MSRTYQTEGIVVKGVNFGEADRILTIYTKHYGKIKAIAKGVRKLTSRKGGNLDLFNHVRLFLTEGKNWDMITEVEVVDSFENLRKDLALAGQAFHVAELVDQLTVEREANRKIFALLLAVLRGKKRIREFEIDLLKELGFGLPEDLSRKLMIHFIENIIEKKLKSKKVFPIPDPRSD